MKNRLMFCFVFFIFIAGCEKQQPEQDAQLVNSKNTASVMVKSIYDYDSDGLDDYSELVAGARKEAEAMTVYKNGYYDGGYPPEGEGVCTDVIWRAYREAGYDLKSLVDADIRDNQEKYPRVMQDGRSDSNIDFRRVPNLQVFFSRCGKTLNSEVPLVMEGNLDSWQAGDIVIFGAPLWHIGIISDRHRRDGIPLVIHNGGPWASESDILLDWPSPIVGHYRFPVE